MTVGALENTGVIQGIAGTVQTTGRHTTNVAAGMAVKAVERIGVSPVTVAGWNNVMAAGGTVW